MSSFINNNNRLLQDHEIESYGGDSSQNINDLLDEVRGVIDQYFNNNNNSTVKKSPISPSQPQQPQSNQTINNIQNNNNVQRANSFGQTPLKISSRFQSQPQLPLPNNNTQQQSQSQQQQQQQQPSRQQVNGTGNGHNIGLYRSVSSNSTPYQPNNQQQQQQVKPIQKKKDTESTLSIDVSKIGLKELSTLLNRRREGSIHIRAIKQILVLYQQSKQVESYKSKFINEVVQGSCLRTLLSFLTLQEPPSTDCFEYIVQLESLYLLAALTENDAIKLFIKQTGDISTIVSVLNWAQKSRSMSLIFPLLTLTSNLATQESCAYVLKRSGAIPPIFGISTNDAIPKDLRIISTNTLIIFASYSDPKISEIIIDNSNSLTTIIKQIYTNSNIQPGDNPMESICIKYLDLLYQVSDCAKTKAIAYECGIERLVELLRVTEIYPAELNKGNYFRTTNTSKTDPTGNQTLLQSKVLSCLEKLSYHDNNRTKIGIAAIYTVLSFLKPMHNIPFDVFRWNTTILERILKLTVQLLNNDNVKQVFMDKSGCSIIVSMISKDFFPSVIVLSCAQILGQIVTPKKTESSKIFFSVEKVMGGDIVPSLMKLFKSYPEEKGLQLLMCKVFIHLGTRDENKQTIFSEGGIQLLHHLLCSSDIEVVASATETLAILSNNKFIRKVLRLLDSIPILIQNVNSNISQPIQKCSIHVLYHISLDDEGLMFLLNENNGLTPNSINGLLFSNDSQTQIHAMKTLSNLTLDEDYLQRFIAKGGIQSVLNSLYSNNENLQFCVLEFLNRIIQNPEAQDYIISEGLIDRLKKLTSHENVTRPSSILLQPLKTLLVTVRSLKLSTPSPSESSPPIDRGMNGSKQSYGGNNYSPRSPVQYSPLNSPNHFGHSSSPLPQQLNGANHYNQASQQQSYKPPDFKKIESVLVKLDSNQLRSVIVEMIKANPTISEVLPVSIKGVLTGNTLPFPTASSNSINSTPQQSPYEMSPNQRTINNGASYHNGNSHQNNNVSSPPPPPAPTFKQNPPNLNAALKQPQALRPVNTNQHHQSNNNSNARKSYRQSTQGFASLMEEIKSKVGSGRIRLRHIDTQQEIENRRKDQVIEKSGTLLKDIVNKAQSRQARQEAKKVLVDSSTTQGMKVWKKDFNLYKQEIQSLFRRNINLAHLLYKILESTEKDFSFQEAYEISQSPNQDQLAQSLVRVGLNVKQSTFIQNNTDFGGDEEQIVEYTSIIRPTGLPIKLLLATIEGELIARLNK
ncbi:hypothetical protein DFA_07811 [Cavenderia fasciculata]|uniref:Armadillo repeat-containing protein n=1 Tax=Cavenderia fasciculata TaxID=261658 RepID=F4Q3G4_CACFS|nr:uncharacterized protein DFA_07811 [Cavenderia fasciculata]EGG16833.1 hypothetical protein DFA_07811 [Cavenderia fasciculata]|eukprot:XP_004355307.1 hypothetical protein DFA_07811 [Cavenderia fasciculata]